jgi:hypothetical protein
MKSNALKQENAERAVTMSDGEAIRRLHPKPVRAARDETVFGNNSLRMYTEEEVAEILQVSISQLRKWRMNKNGGHEQGPPFRKFGRLVRYSAQGLHAFINGVSQEES